MSLSPHILAAYKDLVDRLAVLAVVAGMNADRFQQLPSDDFFVQKTQPLREPIRVFIDEYSDGPEPSFQQATPISAPGSKHILLPLAATAACLLFQLGHAQVGIAVVDSAGRGVVFQYRSREDVVYRQLTEMRLAGGVA